MLNVAGLTANYGHIPILTGISFSARSGEVIGILGNNGMGKTTLMKTLMGFIAPTGGSVHFDGADITREPPFVRARRGIGYVPQGREIFPKLSVLDNLRMGATNAGADRDRVVLSVLQGFPMLERLLNRQGGTLSGGEQQILAIARALCARPKLLLLDEPTEGIQPSIIDLITAALARLAAGAAVTIVIVEQNLEFVASLSSRVLVIQKGSIVRELGVASLHDADIMDDVVGIGR
jgi:branched-chain amino acid transport system ATP-binding protein